jgi:hypothetical protein
MNSQRKNPERKHSVPKVSLEKPVFFIIEAFNEPVPDAL